jgi:hypothetical protein
MGMQASENKLKINSTRQGVNGFRNTSFAIVVKGKGALFIVGALVSSFSEGFIRRVGG